MTINKEKRIGMMVETDVNFFSVKPLLEELRQKYQNLVIFTLDWQKDTMGYQQMFDGVRKLLRESGYEPKTLDEYKGQQFDLYLGPYFYGNEPIESKCNMKYEYGTTNTKPKLTYIPGVNENTDVFLCQSTVNYEILKAYGATYLVDNLRFLGLKRDGATRKKKHVLFAPTYNGDEEAEDLAKIIRALKKEFYVVVKTHHGTNYLSGNAEKKQILEKEADEFYTSEVSLSKLIVEADVFLSDNSSGYAEAMYAGVPCAIYTKDPDYFNWDGMHTTQYLLAEQGVLPWAKKPNEVLGVVKEAMSAEYVKKQKECAEKLFPPEMKTGVEGYMKVIDFYLNDMNAREYCAFHQKLHTQTLAERKKMERLEKEKAKYQDEMKLKELEIENLREIMNGGLHKVADKIYTMRRKINGKS